VVQRTDEEIARPIVCIVSDVDGVLTDGRIVLDNQGVETKSFHTRDGLGIKLWQQAGYQFGLLTSRNSQIVKLRAAELKIGMVRQGFEEKLPVLSEMLQQAELTLDQVCYVGDDLPDIPILQRVGLSVAVADAAPEVKAVAHWTLRTPGGQGAVRELIERLLKAKSRWEECIPQRPVG